MNIENTRQLTSLDAVSAKIAAIILGVMGASSILLLPGLVGVIAGALSLDPNQVGWVASADLITMGLAMLVMAFVIHRVDWRIAAIIALAFLAVGAGWSWYADSFESIIIARLISGWGGGVAMSVAFAILGGMVNPDRQFGFYMIAAPTFGAIGLYLMQAVAPESSQSIVFGSLFLLMVLSVIPMLWLPTKHDNAEQNTSSLSFSNNLPYGLIGLGLTGIFFYFLAQGDVWAYIALIGEAAELSAELIGLALSASAIGGIAGALLATYIHTRFGRAIPLALSALVSLLSVLLLLGDVNTFDFVVAAMLFNLAWNFSQPLFSGLMAELDPKGRVVVMMGAILTIGIGIGPAAAASFIANGFSAVVYIAVAAIIVSQIFILLLIYLHKQHINSDKPA